MHLPKEFKTHGARVVMGTVQNEARRGDDAIATFLLDTRQTGEEFVRYIFTQPEFAKLAAGYFHYLRYAVRCLAICFKAANAKTRPVHIMNLAEVVLQPFHGHPQTIRRNHLPRHQIVQCRTPQYGLLATRIHGDVAANAASVRRGRIHREHQIFSFRRFHYAPGHHARTAMDGTGGLIQAGQLQRFHGKRIQFFRIDNSGSFVQRNCAAGITGAASARDDSQFEFDTGTHQRCNFRLAVRSENHEWIFHTPVGCVGHMRDTRQSIELDIVAPRDAPQYAQGAATQLQGMFELGGKFVDRVVCQLQ